MKIPAAVGFIILWLARLAAWELVAADQTPTTPTHATLTLAYEPPHGLVIHGPHLPGKEIRINYLEAYCRDGSTGADWVRHIAIPHQVEFVSLSDDRKMMGRPGNWCWTFTPPRSKPATRRVRWPMCNETGWRGCGRRKD